ncbi:MAG: hypothetical protein ACPGQS_11850 [Bradymonadia bacterium]
MDAAPFPNSVNAPSPIVIKDKIIDMERIDQISRNSNSKVAATTNYSEFLYKYHNGVVMKTMVKVSHQNYLDIKA